MQEVALRQAEDEPAEDERNPEVYGRLSLSRSKLSMSLAVLRNTLAQILGRTLGFTLAGTVGHLIEPRGESARRAGEPRANVSGKAWLIC